jgi:hypothetical protein
MLEVAKQTIDHTKMKCYVLIVSRFFPKTHPMCGHETYFVDNIENEKKIHTIRLNYELWKKRINEVNSKKAYISLRYWSGSPYNYLRDGSKQIEFGRLYKAGIQKIEMHHFSTKLNQGYLTTIETQIDGRHAGVGLRDVAENDGLMYQDFRRWFFPDYKKNDVHVNGGIIHFTDFRY